MKVAFVVAHRNSRLAPWFLASVGFAAPLDSLRLASLGRASDVFLVIAAVAVVPRRIRGGSRLLAQPFGWVVIAAGTFAIGGLLGTLWSTAPASSLTNVARFSVSTCGLLVVFAGVRPTRGQTRLLAAAYVAGCCLSGVVSLFAFNAVTGRSSGLASHPNVLGLSSGFALGLLFGLGDSSVGWRRWVAFGASLLLLLGISNSGSRSGLLAAAVACGVYLLLTRRTATMVVATAFAGVLAVALLSGFWHPSRESAVGRVLYEGASTQASDAGRVELAEQVLERIADNPVTGSGFASATQAHNIYLQVLDTAGVLGVVAFAWLIVAVLRQPLRYRSQPLVAGGIAMFLAYLAAGVVSNAMWDRWLWFPIAVLLAASAAVHRERRQLSLEQQGPFSGAHEPFTRGHVG